MGTRAVTGTWKNGKGEGVANVTLYFRLMAGGVPVGGYGDTSLIDATRVTVTTGSGGTFSVTLTINDDLLIVTEWEMRGPDDIPRLFVVPAGSGSIDLVTCIGGAAITQSLLGQLMEYVDGVAAGDPAGTAAGLLAGHVAADDPHTGYVRKVTGFGLSKNDFTDELKTKLDGLSGTGGVPWLRTPVPPVDDEGWTFRNQDGATFDFTDTKLNVVCPARNSANYQSSIMDRPFDYSTQSAIIGFNIPPVAGGNLYPSRQGIAMFGGGFFMSLLTSDAGVWGTGYNLDGVSLTTGITANVQGGPLNSGKEIWWKVEPKAGSLCAVFYSTDGGNWTHFADLFDYGATCIGIQVATVGSGQRNQRAEFSVFDFYIY